MGEKVIRFDFPQFRNLMIVSMVVVLLLFSYLAIGEAVTERYIQVDQDIWGFLKYIGVCFLGLLTWAALSMVAQVKSLVGQVNDLNLNVKINNNEVSEIKKDVSEMNSKIEKQDSRLFQLEKSQRN